MVWRLKNNKCLIMNYNNNKLLIQFIIKNLLRIYCSLMCKPMGYNTHILKKEIHMPIIHHFIVVVCFLNICE